MLTRTHAARQAMGTQHTGVESEITSRRLQALLFQVGRQVGSVGKEKDVLAVLTSSHRQ